VKRNKTKWRRCPACNHWFIPRLDRSSGFYCSPKCLEVHSKNTPGKVHRICHNCREEFVTDRSFFPYCSDWCKNFGRVGTAPVDCEGKQISSTGPVDDLAL